jgi:hypothetical protein
LALLIGIDFDNTIAGYDHVFTALAERQGLLQAGIAKSKKDVRTALLGRPDGEQDWMRLQGSVYGAHMKEASLIEGVRDFLTRCRKSDIDLCIVSHKTEFGHFDTERVNLRDAASAWMEDKGFFDPKRYGFQRDAVFFESSREDKINRIAKIGCTHFIDDLEEVFLEPGFPGATERLLFAAEEKQLPTGPFKAFASWREISDALLDRTD